MFWPLAIAVLAVLVVAAVVWGAVPLSLHAIAAAVMGRGDPDTVAIVRTLREPRVALAVLVGAALGMSGGALQGSLRNALAEPYLLGVSGGAAVGAVVVVSMGFATPFLLPLGAFAGAALAIGAAIAVARAAGGRADPRVLLMAGVVIGAFANAAIMVLLADAPPDTPSRYGSASALRSDPCSAPPDMPNAAPTSTASATRGSRSVRTMATVSGSPRPITAAAIAWTESGTAPHTTAATTSTA
ncbi:MAG TPA: iron chelate uptake ABC transporter family permease subunit, partial [Gemmatimonadaceae bacterium]|nr:iron chelate uptake ABC transporter family permease subunit [Gemmatimonadaceae bacterium]